MAWSMMLAGLCACTVNLELAEPRFPKGDLAASSMGLVAQDRWLGSPDERSKLRAPGRHATAGGARAGPQHRSWTASRARDLGAEPAIVMLAPDLALAPAFAPGNRTRDEVLDRGSGVGPGSAGRVILPARYALSFEPSSGPLPGQARAPETLAPLARPHAQAQAAPRPPPLKPAGSQVPVRLPRMKPSQVDDS